VHAGAYAAARTILNKPPNDDAKREALRLLAGDAKSTPLLEKVLRDKKELRENRQLAASALHSLNPDKLQAQARKILLDKSDYADIKATSLTALEQFGDDGSLSKDKTLLQSVNRLKNTKISAKYKQTARRFLSKYSP
jgi:poly-D-alanine transfer protein DltD